MFFAERHNMTEIPAAMGNWWLAASSWQWTCLCITSCAVSLAKYQITQVTQPLYGPDFMLCDFWLFPNLKSPLKGKRFQIVDEIQENTMGQLTEVPTKDFTECLNSGRDAGRTVWGPKVSTLKGTEVSLSYVQCFLCVVSSSINVSIFHSMWMDTFWTEVVVYNKIANISILY